MTAEIVLNIAKDLKHLAESIEKLAREKQSQPGEKGDFPNEIDMGTVRARLAALMQSGKQAEVKILLKRYGGEKLSEIPRENYPALLAEAEEV